MQSRCSHHQDGVYPAFQQQSNIGPPTSNQNNNVSPATVVLTASGIQINIVTPVNPEELRVDDGPAQRRQHNAQSKQNVERHVLNRGFQHPKPGDSMFTPNADINSSLPVSSKCSMANTKSTRRCVNNGGQYEENNATLQQRHHLNCAHSVTTSSVVPVVKSSLYALNREHTRYTPLQQQVHSTSASGKRKPPTDDDILDYLKKQLDISQGTKSIGNLPTTSASDKEIQKYRERQCVSSAHRGIAALGKAHPEEINAEFIPTCDWPTDASGKHSSEYPKIRMEVAATCSKIEDKSPVILILRSGMTSNKLTEKDPSCNSQEDHTSIGLNSNMNLDEMDQVAGVFSTSKHMTVKEEHANLRPVDNVQGLIDVLVDLQTKPRSVIAGNKTSVLASLNEHHDTVPRNRKATETPHCHIADPKVMAHSKVTASVDQIQVHDVRTMSTDQSECLWHLARCEGVKEDAGSVHLQKDLSLELCGRSSKVQEPPLHPEDKGKRHSKVLKDQKYEDISDYEDVSQVLRKLPNREGEKSSFPPCSKVPLFEDENLQMGGLALETHSPEHNKKHLPCEGPPQARMENFSPKWGTLDKAKQCHCPCYVETDDGFEYQLCPKCDEETQLEGQTNHSVLFSPSSDEYKAGDEDDDQMDDWIVIPMSMSDLTFEPDDEVQDVPENLVPNDDESGDKENPTDCETHCPSPKPVAASASYQIEVFPTIHSFLFAKAGQFGNRSEVASRKRSPSSEPKDSSDTEDSCDYPSPSRLTFLSPKRLACLPPVTDDSGSEEESEHDDTKNEQKIQSRNLVKSACIKKLGQLMAAKAGSKQVKPKAKRQTISKKQDLIDSQTEDEDDQNWRRKATRKRIFSDSVDYGNAPWGQQRGHTPEMFDNQHGTVKETADSSTQQHSFKELSHNTGTTGQQMENKVDPDNMNLQHETERKNISEKEVIILDSDTEESDQNHKKEVTQRLISSGLGSYIQQTSSEHVQYITNKRMTSKRGFHNSDRISEKDRKPSSVSIDCVSSLFYSQPGETIISTEESQVKHTQSVDKDEGTNSTPSPVIPRLFVSQSTPPNKNLRLSKVSTAIRHTNVTRQPNKEGPSTSRSASRCLSQSGETISLKLPKTFQSSSSAFKSSKTLLSTSNPKEDTSSSNLVRSLRSTNYEPRREARPLPSHPDRAPRQRHNFYESETPLMKRTRFEAMQLTKATNRVTQREQRSHVGEGYKWSEKPKVTRATKGSTSERRRYRTPRSYQ